jgi:hypothetical protein
LFKKKVRVCKERSLLQVRKLTDFCAMVGWPLRSEGGVSVLALVPLLLRHHRSLGLWIMTISPKSTKSSFSPHHLPHHHNNHFYCFNFTKQ